MKGESKLGDYTLAFDFNALCMAEDEVGPIGEVMQDVQKGSFKIVRALAWAGLQKHHKLTLIETGDFIQEQGFDKVAVAVGEGIQAAFGKGDEGKGEGGQS